MKLTDQQIVELGKAFVQSGLLPKNIALSQQEYCKFIAHNTMDYMEALRELSDD